MSGPEFDMDAAVSDVASGLGFGEPEDLPEGVSEDDTTDPAAPPASDDPPTPSPQGSAPEGEAAAPAPTPRAPPKSWAKETHEQWGKLDPATQEYIEKREKDFLDGSEQWRSEANYAKQFKDIITPYKPMLAAMGIQEPQAIQYLLNAQYRLSNGPAEQRMAAYHQIGRDLGLVTEQADPNAPPMDPHIASLRSELDSVKSALTRVDQERLAAAQSSAQSVVDKFIADPAHSKFTELAPDMAKFIEAGYSLEDAYDKALYANPVLREEQFQQRLTAESEKLKEQKRKEGEDAKRATGQNVRGVESRKAPTEPKGSMDDTMRATLKNIRARAH